MRKSRYPELKEKGKCRGCGAPVPKGRQTWCSSECFEAHDPNTARRLVEQRDKGVCAFCGTDTVEMERKMPNQYGREPIISRYRPLHYDPRFWPNGISGAFDKERYDRGIAIRVKHLKRWDEAAKKRREAFALAGWPTSHLSHWWEADHIIPHSEGGTYALPNMRTLCIRCHKARTKAWHLSRKKVKSATQIELLASV